MVIIHSWCSTSTPWLRWLLFAHGVAPPHPEVVIIRSWCSTSSPWLRWLLFTHGVVPPNPEVVTIHSWCSACTPWLLFTHDVVPPHADWGGCYPVHSWVVRVTSIDMTVRRTLLRVLPLVTRTASVSNRHLSPPWGRGRSVRVSKYLFVCISLPVCLSVRLSVNQVTYQTQLIQLKSIPCS